MPRPSASMMSSRPSIKRGRIPLAPMLGERLDVGNHNRTVLFLIGGKPDDLAIPVQLEPAEVGPLDHRKPGDRTVFLVGCPVIGRDLCGA